MCQINLVKFNHCRNFIVAKYLYLLLLLTEVLGIIFLLFSQNVQNISDDICTSVIWKCKFYFYTNEENCMKRTVYDGNEKSVGT